jgi:hypothetical protein
MTTINIEAAVVRQALAALENARPVGNDDDITGLKRLHISAIASLRTALANPAEQQEPVAFDDRPEYHDQAMGCGLEDRCVTDRYEAMRYRWDEALERAWEAVNLLGPLYTTPPADAKDARIAELGKEVKRLKAQKAHYQDQWSEECNKNQGLLNKLEQAEKDAARPDMFWHCSSYSCWYSIECFLNNEICNGSLEVGAVFTIWRAKKLPSVKIRVTSIDDESCEAEYEIIDAAMKEKP